MDISSLRQLAMRGIVTRIQNGEFSQDSIISESLICETLNMSRTPVREALIELTASGVLQKVPRKGYTVTKFDKKTKIDSYDILSSLDALAAKLALPYMTEEDFMKMREHIELANVAIKFRNYPYYCEQQEKFHSVYIEKCDNIQLITLLKNIKENVDRYTYFSEDEDELFAISEAMNKEHEEIVRLFEEGDKDKLSKYLTDNHWSTRFVDLI
ncbi:MAG: GntR family transcriptional regulator [Sphaerochaetaceae bacterium]